MKRYKEYMDGVKAPDTLHQRLVELEAPVRRPVPWKRYGSMAAALVLVCGVGGFAAWAAHIDGWRAPVPRYEHGFQDVQPETELAVEPDIALVDPGDEDLPGERTLGGYDVTYGSGPEAVVGHYILPYIEYGEADAEMALDWDIPPGAARRDLTRDEIVRLMGGEDVISDHLDWGDHELTGWAAWYEDGSFWGAYIDGFLGYVGGPASQFEFAVTADQLPPTCFGYPDSVTQEIRGLTVTADKADREEHVFSWPSYVYERRVSFMKGEYGYRFEMSCGSGEVAEEMVSRLVARIADRGIDLSLLGGTNDDSFRGDGRCGSGEGEDVVPDYDPAYEDGAAMTQSYDPSHEDGTYICDRCGMTVPVGTVHVDVDVDGTSGPVPCPVCGEPYFVGMEHSHGLCGLPLASSIYQQSPPVLEVRIQLGGGVLESRSGSYTWTYVENAEACSVTACGAHPLQWQYDSPVTAEGTVALDFTDRPDRVSAVCWPDSALGDTSAASQPAQVSWDERAQGYELTLEDGGWIYAVSAQWVDRGTADYVFHLIKN